MSKEQQELLDKAYKKYQSQTMFRTDDLASLEELDGMCLGTGEIKKVYRQYAPKEFIDKCKTDKEFSEKWGLKIEERELSRQERSDYYYKYGDSEGIVEGIVEGSLDLPIWVNDETAYKWYDKRNVPTKLITITYNDKTIESYENNS